MMKTIQARLFLESEIRERGRKYLAEHPELLVRAAPFREDDLDDRGLAATVAYKKRIAGKNQWMGVDLDGTLARNVLGKFSPLRIGPPIPTMINKVKKWIAQGVRVKIFTARLGACNKSEAPLVKHAIENWCIQHIGVVLEVTNIKDPGLTHLYDDRAKGVVPNHGHHLPIPLKMLLEDPVIKKRIEELVAIQREKKASKPFAPV